MENSIFDPCLGICGWEAVAVNSKNTSFRFSDWIFRLNIQIQNPQKWNPGYEGLTVYWIISEDKWTHAVQTCVIQGSNCMFVCLFPCMGIILSRLGQNLPILAQLIQDLCPSSTSESLKEAPQVLLTNWGLLYRVNFSESRTHKGILFNGQLTNVFGPVVQSSLWVARVGERMSAW